jgi:trimethylamine--corrinoid protein Co-methyltransferase
LRTAPRYFRQHARNPTRSVVIGDDNVVFAPAYGSLFVRDLQDGRRYGSLADFEKFVKLTYMIPWLHHSGGTVCEPVDVPVNKRHLDMVSVHLRYSDKPMTVLLTRKRDGAENSTLSTNLTKSQGCHPIFRAYSLKTSLARLLLVEEMPFQDYGG